MFCPRQHLALLTGMQIAVDALHRSKRQSILQTLLSEQDFLKTAICARLEPALPLKRTATLHHNQKHQKHKSNMMMTASRARHVHSIEHSCCLSCPHTCNKPCAKAMSSLFMIALDGQQGLPIYTRFCHSSKSAIQ